MEVVQEDLRKVELVAEEKMRLYKKGCLAEEACDQELWEKVREAQELKAGGVGEHCVALKRAEAEVFQPSSRRQTRPGTRRSGCRASPGLRDN